MMFKVFRCLLCLIKNIKGALECHSLLPYKMDNVILLSLRLHRYIDWHEFIREAMVPNPRGKTFLLFSCNYFFSFDFVVRWTD